MRKIEIFNKFKVGFTHRNDTYSEKLGFINPLMQEASGRKKEKYKYANAFENWRDKSIDLEFFDNEPTSGFVVNYRVGGHYCYYGDNGREPKIRVFDPRGFEIEITLENLVEILEFGVGSGKIIEGEYLYVFRDTHLTLINTKSSLYNEIFESKTDVQEFQQTDELIVGHVYQTSDLGSDIGKYIYLGKHLHYNHGKHKNGYGKVEIVDTFIKYVEYDLKKHTKSFVPFGSPYEYSKQIVRKSNIKYYLGKCKYNLDVELYYKYLNNSGFKTDISIDYQWSYGLHSSRRFIPLDFKKIKTYTNIKSNFVVNYTDSGSQADTNIILDLSNVYRTVKRYSPTGSYYNLYTYNDIAYFFKNYPEDVLDITKNGERFIIVDCKGKKCEVSKIVEITSHEQFTVNIIKDFMLNGGEIKKVKFVKDEYGVMGMVYSDNLTLEELNKHEWYAVNHVYLDYHGSGKDPLYTSYLETLKKDKNDGEITK